MDSEIKEILNKFDKVLENYELDKKFGQMSVDSICHLFPNELLIIKDYLTNLQEENRQTKLLKERYQLEKEDYKSRCKKASGMIQFIAFNSERPLTMTELNKVFSILEGSDKND